MRVSDSAEKLNITNATRKRFDQMLRTYIVVYGCSGLGRVAGKVQNIL